MKVSFLINVFFKSIIGFGAFMEKSYNPNYEEGNLNKLFILISR